jgi:hypothetical protein
MRLEPRRASQARPTRRRVQVIALIDRFGQVTASQAIRVKIDVDGRDHADGYIYTAASSWHAVSRAGSVLDKPFKEVWLDAQQPR